MTNRFSGCDSSKIDQNKRFLPHAHSYNRIFSCDYLIKKGETRRQGKEGGEEEREGKGNGQVERQTSGRLKGTRVEGLMLPFPLEFSYFVFKTFIFKKFLIGV